MPVRARVDEIAQAHRDEPRRRAREDDEQYGPPPPREEERERDHDEHPDGARVEHPLEHRVQPRGQADQQFVELLFPTGDSVGRERGDHDEEDRDHDAHDVTGRRRICPSDTTPKTVGAQCRGAIAVNNPVDSASPRFGSRALPRVTARPSSGTAKR